MIARRRPKLIMIENVMGLLTSRNRSVLEAALSTLSDAGYFVDVVSVNGEQLGLAQRRRRVIIFGRLGKAPFSVKLPVSPRKTVREALKSAGKASGTGSQLLPLRSKARLIAEKIKPGQKLCNVRESAAAVHTWDIPEVFGVTSKAERELLLSMLRLRRTERERSFGDADPVSLKRINDSIGPNATKLLRSLSEKGYVKRIGQKFDLAHTFNGTYRRLAWNDISPTVDTHFGSARLFLHPEEHRGLSIPEAAALQGFDPDFEWPESKASAYRLIGNAVPPPISRAIAKVARGLLS
jgi:DNA (cytosine-5)-methyltransferase 1